MTVAPCFRFPSLIFASLAVAASCLATTEYWVAPGGNDSAPGTREQPLASPALALRRARELRRAFPERAKGGISVFFAAGNYELSEPLLLRHEDSGSPEAPLLLSAAPGAEVVLSGGRVIKKWIRPALPSARLPAAAADKVFVAECQSPGGEPLPVRQLWVAGQKAQRARFPNAPHMCQVRSWDTARREAGMQAEGLPLLADVRGVEMFVMQQWEIANLRLRSLTREGPLAFLRFQDPEARIEFEHPWPQPIMPPQGAGAFMLMGALEFLDSPGEWAQEPSTGRLFYWPRESEELVRDGALVPVLENILVVSGSVSAPVTDVHIRGLTFSHSAWRRPSEQGHVPLQAGMYLIDGYKIDPKGTKDSPRLDNQAWIGRPGAAVQVRGVERLRLESCRFSHTAMSGLDIAQAARFVSVVGCSFLDIGGNGLQAGSFQDGPVETHVPYDPTDERELCRDLLFSNNVIRDAANEDWGCVGLIAGYVRDTRIVHNEISQVSYTAISLGWGWTSAVNCMRNNLVHGNLLHHLATRLCDTAGVYTLSAQPGTVVSENVVRDIHIGPFVDRPDHWFYLYTDEGSAYITVRDNWTESDKYLQNATGPNNRWENNGPAVAKTIQDAAGLEPAGILESRKDPQEIGK